MKILDSKRAETAWGERNPVQLIVILDYLFSRGFEGPSKDSTPEAITLIKRLSPLASFFVTINKVYEDPPGTIHFQSHFGLLLPSLRQAVLESNLWEGANIPVDGVCLFSVGLHFLKWNQEKGEAPTWVVSNMPEHADAGGTWIRDWQEYAEPIERQLCNVEEIFKFALSLGSLKKNPWVLCDGFVGSAIDIYASMLIALEGKPMAALDALNSALAAEQNPKKKERLQKTLRWVENRITGNS